MTGNAISHTTQRDAVGPTAGAARRGQLVRRGRLFALIFWAFTALAVTWLAIGLLPGALAVTDLTFRQMIALAPDPRWLRSAWIGLYVASLGAEPAPALLMQYAFSLLNVALGIVLYRARPGD